MDNILLAQAMASPALDRFFLAATWLGDPNFYSLVLPIIFWTAAPGFAFRLALLVFAAGWMVDTMKEALALPRPDPELRRAFEGVDLGFGFPSGHALVAVAFWGFVAARLKRPWVWASAAGLALLIGVSRIYLGVHWVGDVVGGSALALALLALWLRLDEPVSRAAGRMPLPIVVAIAFAASLILAAVSLGTLGYQMAGVAGGFAGGYAILRERAPAYWTRVDAGRAGLRILIGIAVLALLRYGLKALLPDVAMAEYARYFAMGAWVALGPPLLVPGRPTAGAAQPAAGTAA